MSSGIAFTRSAFQLSLNVALAGLRQIAEAVAPAASGPQVRTLVSPVARIISSLPGPPFESLYWQEFQSKWNVIDIVQNPRDPGDGVLPAIQQAHLRDPFLTVWAIEGIGQEYGNIAMAGKVPLERLFSFTAGRVNSGECAMLHAGMGLSLAITVLDGLPKSPGPSDLRIAIQEVLERCHRASLQGYAGAAIEQLGLTCRFSYSHLVSDIDQELRRTFPSILSYFWHGVGRSIYYLPENFVPAPGDVRPDFEMALTEPKHQIGLANTIAGYAWAFVLVSMRQPQTIENAINANRNSIPVLGAFAYGVFSCARLRLSINPNDAFVRALENHTPQNRDSAFVALWNSTVTRQCARARRSQVRPMENLFRFEGSQPVF
jgi:hypothetical protein